VKGTRARSRALLGLALLLPTVVVCATRIRDADGTFAEAQPLAVDVWQSDQLNCKGGDCADWHVVEVPGPGRLSVQALIEVRGEVAPSLRMTLFDAEEYTLADSRSAGRERFGVRAQATAGGAYRVWIAPEPAKTPAINYRLRVTFEPDPAAAPPPTPVAAAPPPEDDASLPCLRLRASDNLNFYEGQPHVVWVTLLPLTNPIAFEQATAADLLGGSEPAGLAGSSIHVSVAPGQVRDITEPFSSEVTHVGIVADYFRDATHLSASRKAVVATRSRCSNDLVEVGLDAIGLRVEDR